MNCCAQGEADPMPLMQDMMQQLFAKDVMYPSMMEIKAKVWQAEILTSIINLCCSMARGWHRTRPN